MAHYKYLFTLRTSDYQPTKRQHILTSLKANFIEVQQSISLYLLEDAWQYPVFLWSIVDVFQTSDFQQAFQKVTTVEPLYNGHHWGPTFCSL